MRGLLFLVAGIGCGILAYALGRTELLYAAAFLILLPVIGYLIVRLRPLRLSVTRTFSPQVVSAGAATVIELSVRNASSFRSPAATWTDKIPWFPHVVGPGQLPPMPAGGTATTTRNSRRGYTLRPSLRGVYDIGPLEVNYTDPFGMAGGHLTVGGRQTLYVLPVAAPLGEGVSLAVSGDGSARLIQRMATGNDDDLMTREYRTGDALRRVHWRASARHGQLMVRQEEQRTYPEARIILDTRSDGYGGVISAFPFADNGFTWFEWAITMTASIGEHLHRAGFKVQVLETGPRQVDPLGDVNQGSGQDVEFMLSLARVQLIDTETPPGDLGDASVAALGPIFAVVASPAPETLRWITMQRRPYEPAVAFVIESGNPTVVDTLQAAGWICVPVSDQSDPALAWAGISRIATNIPTAAG